MGTSVASLVDNVPFHVRASDRAVTPGVGDAPGDEVTVIADGAQTGLRHTVAIHDLPAGAQAEQHVHMLEDQGFYVIEGEVTFEMPDDGLELTAKAGEFVWQPARRLHGFRVSEAGPARVLHFLMPGAVSPPGPVVRGSAVASLPPRPASTCGPATPDAGVLDPPDSVSLCNSPFKSDAADVKRLKVGRGMMTDVTCVIHAYGHQTGNVFGMIEVIGGPGDVAGPHVHTLEDEGFYVLDGELTLHVSGPEGVATVVAHAGDFIWAPRDMPHYYEVTGATGARVLAYEIPGGTLMDFFYGVTQGQGSEIESDEALEAFARWSAENFGMHFLAPGEFPEH
jgi:quercetin dioxygenase-like cupin family protein